MDIYIDTANISEIREVAEWGILSGVTTNPSLLAKEGRDMSEVISEISQLVPGPISAEVISTDTDGMVSEGLELSRLAENIAVKIPMTTAGLAAVARLSEREVRCNVTLVFSAQQALLAARAGASFVSPFMGRLDDIGTDSARTVTDIAQIFGYYGIDTRIIAASVRHPQHVLDAALAGAHIATIPYTVLQKMASHPLTDAGLDKFLSDWNAHRERAR
ncbi:MAG: fructose-6-phosphate aldolase [Bacillota bacterium]